MAEETASDTGIIDDTRDEPEGASVGSGRGECVGRFDSNGVGFGRLMVTPGLAVAAEFSSNKGCPVPTDGNKVGLVEGIEKAIVGDIVASTAAVGCPR